MYGNSLTKKSCGELWLHMFWRGMTFEKNNKNNIGWMYIVFSYGNIFLLLHRQIVGESQSSWYVSDQLFSQNIWGWEKESTSAWEVSRLLWIKVQIKSLWLFLRTLAESYCQSWQSCLTTAWRRNNSKPMRGVSCMPYLQECRWAFISHHSIASLIFLVICKHFEAVIYKNIVNHLNRNNLGNK